MILCEPTVRKVDDATEDEMRAEIAHFEADLAKKNKEVAPEVPGSLAELLDRAIDAGKTVSLTMDRKRLPFDPDEAYESCGTIREVPPILFRGGGLAAIVERWSGGGNYRVTVEADGIGRQQSVFAIEGPLLPSLPVRIEHRQESHRRLVQAQAAQKEARERRYSFLYPLRQPTGERWTWPGVLEMYECFGEREFLKEYRLLGALAIVLARYHWDTAMGRHKKTWDGIRAILNDEDRAVFDAWLPPFMAERGLHSFFWVIQAYEDEFHHVYDGAPRNVPRIVMEPRRIG